MSEEAEERVITGLLKRGYRQVFEEQWPIMTGGLLIGMEWIQIGRASCRERV